jgi:hypothetical protein
MDKRSKLAGLMGTAILGAMLVSMSLATAVSATDTVSWEGNGTTDGALNSVICDSQNTPYLLWVFTPGGNNTVSAATLHLGGSGSGDFAMNQDNGQWKATTGFFDLGTLTAYVTWTGDLGEGNANLVISHGCPGEQESQPPSEAPSFNDTGEPATDVPSEVNTATIGGAGTSGPSDSSWLLVAAVGVLLASVVVMTPARAKNRR